MSRTFTPAPPVAPIKVAHEQIAMRAYDKWVKRGRPEGTHVQDWLEAERELMAEQSRTALAAGRR